jgi:glyoxylase-like metal-dependent hydrolase (beta-lactamase superfamily II)
MPDTSHPIYYPFPQPPQPAQTLEVVAGVYWLRMPLPFALNHINLWLLRDGDGWTLVDTGYGIETTHQLWERILETAEVQGPVRRVVVTHYHPDHVGCAGWLVERCKCPLWMTEAEFMNAHAARHSFGGWSREQAIRLFTAHGLDAPRLKAQETRAHSYARGVPSMPEEFRRIKNGDTLSIDGHSWRVIVGYGHAPEHATLYCADLGLLISGDQVLPRITTNVGVWGNQPDGDPLGLFLNSFEAFRGLPADTLVLPSHDSVFRGLHARLAMLDEHHAARLSEVESACESPRCATELVPLLFRRSLDDHQLMFAMGETIAHLNHLMYGGRVQRELGSDGIYRFTRR